MSFCPCCLLREFTCVTCWRCVTSSAKLLLSYRNNMTCVCIVNEVNSESEGAAWPTIGGLYWTTSTPDYTIYCIHHISGMIYHKRTEHFEEKPFACEECGAKFGAKSSLKNHKRLHTGEKPYHCQHCDMSFSVAAALAYHTKKKHSEGRTHSRWLWYV